MSICVCMSIRYSNKPILIDPPLQNLNLLKQTSGGELLEMRLLDKKWNRSFFYLPYVYQYLT